MAHSVWGPASRYAGVPHIAVFGRGTPIAVFSQILIAHNLRWNVTRLLGCARFRDITPDAKLLEGVASRSGLNVVAKRLIAYQPYTLSGR
jgi:hypothetical protein